MGAKFHGVVANPVAFWGRRPRFESWWNYFNFLHTEAAPSPILQLKQRGLSDNSKGNVSRGTVSLPVNRKQCHALDNETLEVSIDKCEFLVADIEEVADE